MGTVTNINDYKAKKAGLKKPAVPQAVRIDSLAVGRSFMIDNDESMKQDEFVIVEFQNGADPKVRIVSLMYGSYAKVPYSYMVYPL